MNIYPRELRLPNEDTIYVLAASNADNLKGETSYYIVETTGGYFTIEREIKGLSHYNRYLRAKPYLFEKGKYCFDWIDELDYTPLFKLNLFEKGEYFIKWMDEVTKPVFTLYDGVSRDKEKVLTTLKKYLQCLNEGEDLIEIKSRDKINLDDL